MNDLEATPSRSAPGRARERLRLLRDVATTGAVIVLAAMLGAFFVANAAAVANTAWNGAAAFCSDLQRFLATAGRI